jgi:hypothetical protein
MTGMNITGPQGFAGFIPDITLAAILTLSIAIFTGEALTILVCRGAGTVLSILHGYIPLFTGHIPITGIHGMAVMEFIMVIMVTRCHFAGARFPTIPVTGADQAAIPV